MQKKNTHSASQDIEAKSYQKGKQLETLKLRLWEEINKAIENGIDTFYFGACYGFDLMCADIVAKRKTSNQNE